MRRMSVAASSPFKGCLLYFCFSLLLLLFDCFLIAFCFVGFIAFIAFNAFLEFWSSGVLEFGVLFSRAMSSHLHAVPDVSTS